MQQKTSESAVALYWQQIEAFKSKQNFTWPEVAEKIGVSVAMLMMVKAGKRKLGRKAIERFRQVRRASGPEVGFVMWPMKVLQESLIRLSHAVDKGRYGKGFLQFFSKEFNEAVAQIPEEDFTVGKVKMEIEHKSGVPPKGFPPSVALVAPDARQSAEALVRFLSQIEERELLFACIESKWRRVEFFDQLISPSAYALCYAASRLIVSSYDAQAEAELQKQFERLDTDELVTAHEALLQERDRFREFYVEFYDFVSPILNSELARRLKLDYRPTLEPKRVAV